MAKTPQSSNALDSLVEIFVPTVCRCRQPLPDSRLTEVLAETKAKMSEWFGGGSVKVERIEGFWGGEDGTTVEEPVYLVFSNTDAAKIADCYDEVTAYTAGIANRLTQEATALRIDGKMYQFPSTGDPKPHRCGGGSATARISDPRAADKNTRMRFLQASLQRVNSLSGIRDVFCNHLHYEFADDTMPTTRWPDALKQFLVPGTAPRVVADQNGFRIIYLQLADNCLRKGQERQLIQRLIKDDPALRGLVVVSDVDQKQWNFINAKFGREQESGKNKERMLLRRMRVGSGQPVRTAVERLIEIDVDFLGEDKDAAAIQDAHDKAFDVDAVTKQFFTEIAGWYFWALPQVKFPNDTGEPDEKVRATSLIRMLTRIIFCWFLREKKLIPPNLFEQREVAGILKNLKPESSSYYQGILQNLFFATLNQRMGKDKHGRAYRAFARDEGYSKNRSNYGVDTLYRYEGHFREPDKALDLFADIPFLNGGLFECLDRTDEDSGVKIYIDGFSRNPRKSAKVPNDLFFAEERTVDLSEDFGDTRRRREKVRGLIRILHSYNFTIEENTPVDEEVALDPELLGKVFENLLASYNEETKKTARKQTGSFYTPRLIVDYMVNESLKAHFTRVLGEKVGMNETGAKAALDQLFSYDTEPHQFSEDQVAILISAIDEVKILDPACGSGAFPMGALHKLVYILGKLDRGNERWKRTQLAKLDSVEMREVLEASFADNNVDYARKLYLIENCLYGVDIQPIAIQITKLRFFISLVCDQRTNRSKKDNHGIRPLPNLETKFVAADTLMGLPEVTQSLLVDPRVGLIEKEIESLYHSHFSVQRRDQKLALQRKIKTLRQELAKLLGESLMSPAKSKHVAEWDPFDPQSRADFFDPHWMFGASLANGFDVVIGNPPYVLLQNTRLDPSYQSSLMKQYVAAQYKVDLYHLFIEAGIAVLSEEGVLTYITPNTFLKNKHTNRLRELMVTKTKVKSVVLFYRRVFEDPSVDNLIFLCQKARSSRDAIANTVYVSEIRDGELEEQLQISRPFPQANVKPPEFSFELDITNDAAGLLAKIEQGSAPFGEIGGSYFGIQTFDRKKFVSIEKRSSSFRPAIDGGNVFRFYMKPSTDFVDFRPEAIKSGGDPDIYSRERIVVRQIGKYPEGTLCPQGLVTLNTIYNLYLNNDGFDLRFVLAIINSRVIRYYWLCRFFDNKETFPKIKKAPLHSIPIKRCNSGTQKVFANVVDRIFAAKRANPAADTSDLEREIDQQVYGLYGLTPEEIKIVEDAAA